MNHRKEDLIYLFDIEDKNNKHYFLTSSSRTVITDSKKYLPYSGLSLMSGGFNDSAINHVVIHGVFEENGINKKNDLTGSRIKITYLKNNQIDHLITYVCTQHLIKDLEFEMKCESEAIKYNKSLLQMFSKTCRANFCDSKCKININEYYFNSTIDEVENNILTCDIGQYDHEYFTGGKLIIKNEEEEYKFTIISQIGSKIEVDSGVKFEFLEKMKVILVPTCDKQFSTCCDVFKNSVNFRGEPHIPEFSNIEN